MKSATLIEGVPAGSFDMKRHSDGARILVIDDNPAIHEDFRKIFAPTPGGDAELAASAAALFGTAQSAPQRPVYRLDFALQGQQGVESARRALAEGRPYAMAFVDVRLPPGWDGIETITRLWEVDPDLQVVICTAYSDYSWDQTREKLRHAHRFIVLKKPFDNIEVLQLAEALTEKWRLERRERRRFEDLEARIRERNRDLQAIQSVNAQLDALNQQLTAARASIEDTQTRERHVLERELRHALAQRALTVHYQPLVEIATRRVVGLEALARWQHPKLGWVPPAHFIAAAEASGLIAPLGEFVLRAVCEQIARWDSARVPAVRVAVNLSPIQFERQSPETLVRTILLDTGIQPHRLALELTETALVQNLPALATALRGLRQDGVHIAMDDFGTGFSSLSNLKHLPIDTLKIDRSFIQHLDTNGSDEAIIATILTLARELHLQVVAEGVETVGQLQALGRAGCQMAQGYYFSRPLPAAECRDLLLEVEDRSSFTDTLCMKLAGSAR